MLPLLDMINEPLIHKRYLEMPLAELQSRSAQLEAERRNYGKGQLPHGLSVYRRRLMRALEQKEAEQVAQKERLLQSEVRPVNSRLTLQQRYDKGYQQGRRDALAGGESTEWDLDDAEEQRGYRDGFRSASASQRSTLAGGWAAYRF